MKSFDDVFSFVKTYCQREMNEVAFNMWIEPIQAVSLNGDLVVLQVPSKFQKKTIEGMYINLLKEAFFAVLGFNISIDLVTEEDQEMSILTPEELNPSFLGEYEYSFETFIVGNSNKFAHAAAQAIAQNPSGSDGYNPLFIHGGSGLGKTHLLCAICNEVKRKYKNFNVIYVKGEDFTNEIIEAIQKKQTPEFRKKYRTADILMVDDIQFIAGKEGTQDEFFHTFEALHAAKKQIVLVSDRPPKEIKTLEERLRTRFEWGLIADIQPPDYETRIAILKRKAELLNVSIPNDVCDFICSKVKNNIRQLEGIVKKLKALHMYSGNVITVGLAQTAMKDMLNENQPVSVTVDKIISEVARSFSVTPQEIRSENRSAHVSAARQAAMHIIREVTGMPMASIGAEFGGKDHATVVYSLKKFKKRMEEESNIKELTEDIIRNIKER